MDAQTIAFGHARDSLYHATGYDRITDLVEEFEGWSMDQPWLKTYMENMPLSPGSECTAAWFERICLLFMEILQEPQGASDRALAGVWISLSWAISAKSLDVTLKLVDAGVFELATAGLRRSAPGEWLSWRTPTGVLASATWMLAWAFSTVHFPDELEVNKAQLLLEKGFIDLALEAIQEFERRGPSKVGESCASKSSTWYNLPLLV